MVNGTETRLNTEILNVEDNNITLNYGQTTPSLDGGITIDRGSGTDVLLRWNETQDYWEFTNNGTNYYKLIAAFNDVEGVNVSSATSGDYLRYDGANWIPTNIDLGTDTVGDFVQSLVAGTGITLTNNSGENATPTIAIGQAVGTTDNVTFNTVTADLTGNASTATSLQTARDIQISGDVSGSVSFDGTSNVNIAATIQPDSVALGTDTTGDYVQNLVAGNGVTLTNNSGEGSTPTIALDAAASVTFEDITVNGLLDASHIHGQLAGPVYIHVKNTSGDTIAKGSPVYATGSVGVSGATEVAASDASTGSTMPALGITTAELVNNAEGHAVILGVISNLNTSSYNVNDSLYVAEGGGVTITRPTAIGSQVQKIARVIRKDATTGELLVLGAGRSNDAPNDIEAVRVYASYYDIAASTYTPGSPPSHQEGRLFYDSTNDTLRMQTSDIGVDIAIGQERSLYVYNGTGSEVTKGSVVYYDGENAAIPTIALAKADAYSTTQAVGVVKGNIPNGAYGFVIEEGILLGANTSGFSVGDILHVSPTVAGGLVSTSPTYPNWAVEVATVLASDATNGCYRVHIRSEAVENLRTQGELRVGGDLTVAGDLSVLGTQSTIAVNNLSVDDSWIYLNGGDTIATTSFSGSGLNDGTLTGHYTGTSTTTYYVRIDGVGTGSGGVDTFEWSKDNFSTTEATAVGINASGNTLDNGISIEFVSTTGHTLNDTWSGTASPVNVDVGFAGNYNDGGYTHAGLFRDTDDSRWKFFNAYDPEPDGNLNTSHATFALADVQADTFYGALSGNATTASTLETARTISLSGDVAGSVSFNGSGDVDITATIQADSVALGTDTTGNYVAALSESTGVTITNPTGEGQTASIAIGQDVATTANVTFAGATIDAVQVGVTAAGEIDTSSGNLTLDSAGGTVTVDDDLSVTGSATVTGNLTVSTAPTQDTHAATKAYVDGVASGINWHEAAYLATAASLGNSPSYSNGTNGVGATLTATTNGRLSVDGQNANTGDRILVKNQSTATQNGIYEVTDQGSSTTTYELTRVTDADNSVDGQVKAGDAIFVTNGSTNSNQGFILTSYGTGTDAAHTLGTDSLTYTQFTGTSTFLAGTGLTKTGNTLDVVTADSGRIVVNADNIDLATVSRSNTSAADTVVFVSSVTTDSYGRVTGVATASASIELGTNTTGNYVESLVAGTGITISSPSGEGVSSTIDLTNDNVVLGTTTLTLGSTVDTLAGLASVTSTNFTGDLTGDLTGDVDGNLVGDVYAANGSSIILSNGTDGTDAQFNGDVVGDVTGDLSGQVTGSLVGDVISSNGLVTILDSGTDGTNATFTGAVTGNLTGDVTGDLIGDIYASNGTSLVLDSGTDGTDATFSGTADTADSWTNARTITLGGDLSGSVSIDGSGDVTLTATIGSDAIELGTDTTGNYVATLTAGTGVTVVSGTGESSAASVSIGQAVATSDNVTFNTVTGTNGVITLTSTGAPSSTIADGALGVDTSGNGLYFRSGSTWIEVRNAGDVALGTETTGDYVQSLVAGTGITITNNSGEGSTPTIALDQAVSTTSDVEFNDLVVAGNLTVNGTTTTLNSTTLTVDDKNIELGSVGTPTDTTADGGGITLKGATDKTINWVSSTGAWTFSEHIGLAAGKAFFINGTEKLSEFRLAASVNIDGSKIVLKGSTDPDDGSIAWNTTSDKILVYNGSTDLEFVPSTIVTNARTANYTLVLSDKDKLVEMSVGSANTVTVPPNSSVAYPVGTQIQILQTGAGQTTLVAGSGVTVNGTPGLKLRDRWSSATLIKRATDVWVAIGDLAS